MVRVRCNPNIAKPDRSPRNRIRTAQIQNQSTLKHITEQPYVICRPFAGHATGHVFAG